MLDRDALAWRISDVLMRIYDNGTSPNARREAEEVVKAIEDDLDGVRPAAIDRDALIDFVRTTPFEFEGVPQYTEEEYADMILALGYETEAYPDEVPD